MTKYITICMLIFLFPCCPPYEPYDDQVRIEIRILSDSMVTDSIYIKGLYAETKTLKEYFERNWQDTGVYVANVSLPLRYSKTESSLELRFRDRIDTITFTYTPKVYGSTYYGRCSDDKYFIVHDNIAVKKITLDTIYDEKYNTGQINYSFLTAYYK